MRAVLQTAYNKQEYIPPFLAHFDTINIRPSYIKKAPHIFKYINEYQSELLQRDLNT